jgi:Mrp family chromosome partitioning ATPase
VRALARLPAPAADGARPGTLRRGEVEAFGAILEKVGAGPVLVTGAGEGRRAVSVGLASAATARGARTALLECDLEEPFLAGVLGLAERPGLREYLRSEAEAPEILQPLVLAGPGSGGATEPLVCIVAGEPAAGDGTLPLDSEGFHHTVAKLRGGYGLVVLHGPPLGDRTGALASAAPLAGLVLACVGPALTSGRAGRQLKRVLRSLPVKSEVVVCA